MVIIGPWLGELQFIQNPPLQAVPGRWRFVNGVWSEIIVPEPPVPPIDPPSMEELVTALDILTGGKDDELD